MNPVKERVGVPPGKDSCHIAEVAGYFIKGHVLAEDGSTSVYARHGD